MAESPPSLVSVTEDARIAQITRGIAATSLQPSTPSSSTQSPTYRDKPLPSATYRRAPKKGHGHASQASHSSGVSKTDRSAPQRTIPRSQVPPSSANSSGEPHVNFDASNNTEPNDEELENNLISLVRVMSANGAHPPSSTSPISDLDSSKENFEWLISTVSQRASQQGPLSPSRHQLALFLIALHRRDERRLSINPYSKSAFQVHWTSELLTVVLELLITSISASYSPSTHAAHLDSLRALSIVLFDTSKLYASHYSRLLACLRPLCDVKNVIDKEVQRVAFNCLANMCYKSGSTGQAHYEEIWAIFQRQAALLQPQVLTQISFTRVFSALLRGLQFIIPEAKAIHEAGLPSLVSMLHKFIFYGTPLGNVSSALGPPSSGHLGSTSPSFNAPPSLSDGEDNDDDGISTGSEYSGSDVYSDKHGLWKVRYHSLGCLQSVARASSEKFIQFWAHLLPQSSHQPSLISILQIDSVHQVRSAACRLLSAMFDGQHSFLDASNARRSVRAPPSPNAPSLANSNGAKPTSSNLSTSANGIATTSTPKKSAAASSRSPKTASPKSFTPLSMQLSNMLQEVHLGLYKALASESRPTTIVAIVKTIGILAQETPYDTLSGGMLTKILQYLQRFALDGSFDIRLVRSSISTIASCIGARCTSPEVENYLHGSNGTLVVTHLESLLLADTNTSVKTEIFRFFSSLASNFPLIIIPHWNAIFKCILTTTSGEDAHETDPNLRHAASKCVDDLSRTVLQRLALPSTPSIATLETFTSGLWQSILNSKITELMVKDRFGLVRSSVCNLFSQIPPGVFANLSRKQQVICITLLLGATSDDVPAVRAQAARALGIYIQNSALKIDPLFVSDVALALAMTMKDKNLNVRVKSAWSAANLCDSLVTLRESAVHVSVDNEEDDTDGNDSTTRDGNAESSSFEGEVVDLPRETLLTLVKSLLLLHKDNDKVRCNAVRALGNFIRFTSAKVFAGEGDLLTQLVETLLQLTREGSAKVRWNSCYALANLFHNRYIVTNQHAACIRAAETLLHALNTSTNFKVRINAATALYFAFSSGVLESDQKLIVSIIEALVATVSSIDALASDSASSADLRYRESLREQLRILAIGCIIRLKDVQSSADSIAAYKRHGEALGTLLQTTIELPEPSPTTADEALNAANDDQDELSSHSQLKPPSAQELRVLTQEALTFLSSLSTL